MSTSNITDLDIVEVREYLLRLPPEERTRPIMRVPFCTFPADPAHFVRSDVPRPLAPRILNTIAYTLRNGTQRERNDALLDLADLYYGVWAFGLQHGGTRLRDRGDLRDERAKWDRVQTERYIADASRMTGEVLGVMLAVPQRLDAELLRKTEQTKQYVVDSGQMPIVSIGIWHTQPNVEFKLDAHMLYSRHWIDAAGYVQGTEKPKAEAEKAA